MPKRAATSRSAGRNAQTTLPYHGRTIQCYRLESTPTSFWGDERMVALENPESNYGTFFRTLINTKLIDQQQVFPITYAEKSLNDYRSKLEEQVPFHNGFPQFDVIILGLGEDGHVASIFP